MDNADIERWNVYHSKGPQEDKHSRYAEEKEALFPRGSLVCDLGGGMGEDAIYFLKNGHRVIIMDISDYALKIAQDKAKKANVADKLEVKHVDFGLDALPLVDESVEVVYSRLSLHYFPGEDMKRILKEIYRVLKKEGRAYITLRSPEDKEEMDYLRAVASEYEPGVFIENGQLRSRFSSEQLQDILEKSGFSKFEIVPYRENRGDKILLLNEVILTKD